MMCFCWEFILQYIWEVCYLSYQWCIFDEGISGIAMSKIRHYKACFRKVYIQEELED